MASVSMDVDTGDTANGNKDANGDVDLESAVVEDIKDFVKLLERAVTAGDARSVVRPVRGLGYVRKHLTPVVLRRIIRGLCLNKEDKTYFAQYIGDLIDEPKNLSPYGSVFQKLANAVHKQGTMIPEVTVYLHLLILLHLLDAGKNSEALSCAETLVGKVIANTRRTMDPLAARVYFYYARAYEVNGKLSSIRRFLLSRLRTATLRQDDDGQAHLVNCLLRSYIQDNLYDQAEKLVGKLSYPESVHNNQLARFQYYLGRIKAMKLEYSEAYQHLLQASRKVPTHGAVGFKQTVQKWLITVELLLGDIPERAVFLEKEYKRCLAPYYELTLAIRGGKLARFNDTLKQHADKFKQDQTYSLIVRLRHNVIKTGIRAINTAYSRISIADVAKKLQLDSVEDVYFILAKAISERAIEAQLLADAGELASKENVNIYATKDPFVAFDKRIRFCLETYDQSVKAMRFPPKSYHGDLESAEERREREAQEAELAKEIADEDDDIL
ncbi:probable 26S proteasome non-ATPase regulatory subunit 3 [Paramacrobiotus metropolitanus]|uniref:probable 26S proteasome non-ATPase regulatory subunit 3 n=1 Tax=Paramacrobiotus metropolitanus TaxID=2943436 RepID=UPI0024465837|nr:probable 26S proteasome non-ATPase regulatory subunit 3 [Paramacrobiotus metropolitanus]